MTTPIHMNWAGNQRWTPASVVHPTSEDELAAAIREAGAAGRRVRAIGSGHSFTAIAATDGVQVVLDRWRGLIEVDPGSGAATFRAGTTLAEIPQLLGAHGLAMENLGDVDRQTLAGAISTGTHGTGDRYGGLASQVRAMTLVLADGSVLRCAADERPELFAAARVGLGAFGIVSTITLGGVPAFLLDADECVVALAEMLETFLPLAASHDHVEFYWFPHTSRTLRKIDTRLPIDAEPRPLGRRRAWFDDEFLANDVYSVLQRIGHHVPALIPSFNRTEARLLGSRTYRDASDRVFTSTRRVPFREMEVAVPRDVVIEALREVRATIARRGWRISFPIEVRTAAGDDIWLSTAYARPSAYVAVHQYWRDQEDDYLPTIEAILMEAGGRPHWGKLHTQGAASLAGRYPRFEDARRVRAEVDPERRFTNPYLERVLGD